MDPHKKNDAKTIYFFLKVKQTVRWYVCHTYRNHNKYDYLTLILSEINI